MTLPKLKFAAQMVSKSLIRSPIPTLSKVFSPAAWRHLLRGAKIRGVDGGEWDGDAIKERRYSDYEAYLAHQRSKLPIVDAHLRENEDVSYRKFRARFEACSELAACREIVCLGARLGTEVRVLIELGHFAVGVDVEPGPSNCYVLTGDFHKLVFSNHTVDAAYTNCLDHIFDLERFVGEVTRVVRSGGVFVADYQVADTPDGFSSLNWDSQEGLIGELERLGLSVVRTSSLAPHGSHGWAQTVFRV